MDPMAATKRRKPKAERKEMQLRLRLTATEKRAFTAAATREDRSLSNWLRRVARRAAGLTDVA